MEPHPNTRIPIYVGGTTEPALRRAARFGDGWLGIIHKVEDIKTVVPELMRQRREYARDKEPFDIVLQCPETATVDDIRRLEDLGVTDFWIVPWAFYASQDEKRRLAEARGAAALFKVQPPLQVKLDAIRRYADEVICKFE
jgi:hypothetical protein